ncbi:MAG: glucuronate isomerase [Bacteroidota bacterium]
MTDHQQVKYNGGSSWWFLDQKDGMTKQINTLSNMGLPEPLHWHAHRFKKFSFFSPS